MEEKDCEIDDEDEYDDDDVEIDTSFWLEFWYLGSGIETEEESREELRDVFVFSSWSILDAIEDEDEDEEEETEADDMFNFDFITEESRGLGICL